MGDQNKTLSLRASKAPDGRARIVASIDNRELLVDVVDLWSDADRDRLADAIHRACPAIPMAEIQRRLLVIDRENLPAGDEPIESAWDDPEPLPDPLPSVMAYSADLLPREVGEAVDDIADRMQCPPDFPAASMLVALAAVIGCRVGIRPRRFDDWLVIPNLWGCVVGRPSLRKSPAISHAEKRIRALEARERERVADDVEAFNVDTMIWEADIKAAKKAIEKAVNTDNREEARRLALEIQAMEEASPPTPRRIITTDSTIEKLGEMLNKYPDGMLLWVDELVGWMRGLDRHDMAGVRQQFLTLWNGQGRLNIDRVGRGETVVEHPCLSVFGCATPGGIGDYVAAALRGGRGDDGLIQRLQVLVWPDSPREYRQVDRWPNSVARDRLVSVFESLADLDVDSFAERDEFDDGSGIPWVRFDADAQSVFDRWDVETQNRIRAGDLPESFESHLSKYASLIPSIALIVYLARGERGPIDSMAVEMALKWAEYLESHAARLYSIAMAPERRLAKQLLRKLIAWPEAKPIRVRDIVRHCWSGLDDEEVVNQSLEMLADAGWVRAVTVRPESGRPTTNYSLHPRAAEFFKTLNTPTDKTDETRPMRSSVSFDSADLGVIEKNASPETSARRVRGVI